MLSVPNKAWGPFPLWLEGGRVPVPEGHPGSWMEFLWKSLRVTAAFTWSPVDQSIFQRGPWGKQGDLVWQDV